MSKNLQIRDLDDDVYETLRSRAGAEDLSLNQFLRRELTHLARTPTMADLLDRADERRRRGGGVSRAAIDDAVADLHAEREARAER